MPRVHPVIFKVREAVENSGWKFNKIYYEPQPPCSPRRFIAAQLRLKFIRLHELLPDEYKEQIHIEIINRLALYNVEYIRAMWQTNMKTPYYPDYDFYVVEIPWKCRILRDMGKWYKEPKAVYKSGIREGRTILSHVLTEKIDPDILLPKTDEE